MPAHSSDTAGPAPSAAQQSPLGLLAYQSNEYQAMRDMDHLRLLSLFHYIYGGIVIGMSCMAIFHLVVGIALIVNPRAFPAPPGARPPDPLLGWLFAIIGGSVLLLGWTVGLLTIFSGRWIKQRRRRVFSMVLAGINCMWVPLGTVLGVFTFIILLRDSVQTLYEPQAGAAPPVGR